MVIQHNMAAINAGRQMNIVTDTKKKSMEKLSSGYRINRAADDAAGLSISEKMRQMIRGLNRGVENTKDGISFVQIGDGAMEEVGDMIHRISELSIQAANGTNSDSDREAINNEVKQLKDAINQIGNNTKFNELKVFDGDFKVPGIKVEAWYLSYEDLDLFQPSVVNQKMTFGGIYLNRDRKVTWDQIDKDMVTLKNGVQIFNAGTYEYDPGDGQKFIITSQGGPTPPRVAREIKVTLSQAESFRVRGKEYFFSDLYDKDGYNTSLLDIKTGIYTLGKEVNAPEIKIQVTEGPDKLALGDFKEAVEQGIINPENISYQELFDGMTKEYSSVVTKKTDPSRVTEKNKDYTGERRLRAGDGTNGTYDGLWLEKKLNNKWVEVPGSNKTWEEIGIKDASWTSGTQIADYSLNQIALSYFEDTLDSPIAQFDILSRVATKANLITGLDGLEIFMHDYTTHYEPGVVQKGSDTKSLSVLRSEPLVKFSEEYAWGRNFDDQTRQNLVQAPIQLQGSTASLAFGSGNTTLTFSGDVSAQMGKMLSDSYTVLTKEVQRIQAAVLAGVSDPHQKQKDLKDVLGTGNVTTSGRFDTKVQLGNPIVCAYMDFKNISSSNIMDLDNTGFYSTCETCADRFGVRFTMFDDECPETYTDSSGKQYKFAFSKAAPWIPDYELKIDLNSFVKNGDTTPEAIAKKIAELATYKYDFHFNCYAADGSKLYVYDGRIGDGYPARIGEFSTAPVLPDTERDYSIKVQSDDGRWLSLDYTQDLYSVSDRVNVEVKEDSNGAYVKDGTGKKYRLYDALMDGSVQRYSLKTTFLDKDGNTVSTGADQNNIAQTAAAYANETFASMLNNTTIGLSATDYTTRSFFTLHTNRSMAIESPFHSIIIVDGTNASKSIKIQHSGEVGDQTIIPQFMLNTYTLGLIRADCSTEEKATKTIDLANNALRILTQKRSLYGALQNRLEHVINNRKNTAENTQAAESRIRDTDMADEMEKYSKNSILAQAGQAVLAQANNSNQGVLSLLQ